MPMEKQSAAQDALSQAAALDGAQTPAEEFARWLERGPALAKAAGCYVGIRVTRAALSRATSPAE